MKHEILGVHNQGNRAALDQDCHDDILDYERTLGHEPMDDSAGMDFLDGDGSLSGSGPNMLMPCAPVVPSSEQTDEISCINAEIIDSESDQTSPRSMFVRVDYIHSVLLDAHCE